MCTAITYNAEDFYFGRNLDVVHGFGERIAITPRNCAFELRNGKKITRHYAIIGVAAISGGYPLYYDAVNEKGLCIAGLNFPDNAFYGEFCTERENIASFELIPWVLGKFSSVDEAVCALSGINIWNEAFAEAFPPSPLHWILADETRSVTLEPTSEGIKIYDNPTGVLTNNPPFEFHMHNLVNYINLTARIPENRFSDVLGLSPYSLGMGAIGLPGDMSSASRFVRAAFMKFNSVQGNRQENVNRFFHILQNVAQPYGVTYTDENAPEYTLYSGCCNASRGIYYYTTHGNCRITSVDMHREDLNGDKIITYPMLTESDILKQN